MTFVAAIRRHQVFSPFPRELCALALACCVGVAATAQTMPATMPAAAVDVKGEVHDAARVWTLVLPRTDPVAFKGIASFDGAGTTTAPMAYPAPNAAGLLVAVLMHGAINEAAKNAQKAEIQQAADKVLLPYQAILARLTHAQLIGAVPATATDAGAPTTSPLWRIESTPLFGMTPDQAALVLDNEVIVYRVGETSPPRYRSTVRVVSAPVNVPDPVAYWSADDGGRLLKEAASLLHESAELAAAQAAGTLPKGAKTQQTFRYSEGLRERIERAELIADRCARRVLRTLRETLLSVPGDAKSAACAAAAVAADFPPPGEQ